MLAQLHIENVAVIEEADLNLEAGFNVLTGETGAGKSILIDSINFALGERTSRDIVRHGAPSAHVTALFTGISLAIREKLQELGFTYDEDGSLLISRDLSSDGKSSCRISGRPATVSMVREIGRLLVNIHGQHDNQALLSPEKHIVYLDRYAGIAGLLNDYTLSYHKMRQYMKDLSKIQTDEAAKARRIDLLNYQIQEIESAALKPGEDDELDARRTMIRNAGRIAQAVGDAYATLSGGEDSPGAQELVAAAAENLNSITEFYPEIAALASRIASLSFELDDCVTDLRSYVDSADYGEDDIETIEQRLDTVYRLKLKYGGSIEAVLLYLENSQAELEAIEHSDETAKLLSKHIAEEQGICAKIAAEITQKRSRAALEMQKKIQNELSFLEMPGVEFQVSIKPLGELSQSGADEVEFLISANPGSPLRPLARIASGGEISRVMLAIKSVLAGNDDIETLIFDEIDTGVSGRAAQRIGMKLKEVSQGRQVVCVTHLAQIASQADRHILIEKNMKEHKTFTSLRTLHYEGRKQELARIIGGVDITRITLQNAGEMLEKAGIDPKK